MPKTSLLSSLSFLLLASLGLAQSQVPQLKIKGTITDLETHQTIGGALVQLRCANGRRFQTETDAQGHYAFDADLIGRRIVEPGTSYDITVFTPSDATVNGVSGFFYLPASAKVSTADVDKSSVLVRDIGMACTSCHGGHKKLPEIRFADCVDLLQDEEQNGYDSLHYVLNILRENAGLVLVVSAQSLLFPADSSNAICERNMANVCKSFLIKNGIDHQRLVSSGVGESMANSTMSEMDSLPKQVTNERINARAQGVQFRVFSWGYSAQ